MKEILEYTGSIHQLRRWSQGLFGYEFAIIHRAASMMKDVDRLSRHIDILIHRYLTQASSIRLAGIALRPFDCRFDSFISCSNPCRVTASDITITTDASSTLPHFPSFVTLQLTLLPHLFFNHIPFQNLFQIPCITLFLLKTLYGSLLTQLPPLSAHSFLFGQEELSLTSSSKQTCKIIALFHSSPYLLYHSIQYCHTSFIILNCLNIYILHLILIPMLHLFVRIMQPRY